MLIDSAEPERDANFASSDEARPMDSEEELTPRPRQTGDQEPAVDISDDNEPFQTPLVLKQRKRSNRPFVMDSDGEDIEALAAQQRIEAELAGYKQMEPAKRKGEQMEESAGVSKKKRTMGIVTKPVGGYKQWVIN